MLKKEIFFIETAKNGNEHGFIQLYKMHNRYIYNYLVRKTADLYLVEHIISVTFEKAFSRIHSYKDQGYNFRSWLIAIANNSLIDHIRKEKGNKYIYLSDVENNGLLFCATDNKSFEDKIEELKRENVLKNTLENLSIEERQVVDLYYYKDMSYKEITIVANISIEKVKIRLYRAKIKLKEILTKSNYSLA